MCLSGSRARDAGTLGSATVSEIELARLLLDDWTNVLIWLRNLDLLRSSGLGFVTMGVRN
jgi:hypothetical protein